MIAKSIAHSTSATFINVRASTLQNKWFGESQKLIRAVFSLAHKCAPSIIFFDECDSFMHKRGHMDHEAGASMKSEFLALWDGLLSSDNTNENIVTVIAATNRPFDIDAAFLRRMPRSFLFPLPDTRERLVLLTHMLRDYRLSSDVTLSQLADMTKDYSGSDLKEFCSFAAMIQMRKMIKEHSKNNYNKIMKEGKGGEKEQESEERKEEKDEPHSTNEQIELSPEASLSTDSASSSTSSLSLPSAATSSSSSSSSSFSSSILRPGFVSTHPHQLSLVSSRSSADNSHTHWTCDACNKPIQFNESLTGAEVAKSTSDSFAASSTNNSYAAAAASPPSSTSSSSSSSSSSLSSAAACSAGSMSCEACSYDLHIECFQLLRDVDTSHSTSASSSSASSPLPSVSAFLSARPLRMNDFRISLRSVRPTGSECMKVLKQFEQQHRGGLPILADEEDESENQDEQNHSSSHDEDDDDIDALYA